MVSLFAELVITSLGAEAPISFSIKKRLWSPQILSSIRPDLVRSNLLLRFRATPRRHAPPFVDDSQENRGEAFLFKHWHVHLRYGSYRAKK